MTAPTVGLSGAVKFEMAPDGEPVFRREAEVESVDRGPPEMTPAHVGWSAVVATLGAATAAVGQEPTETPPSDRWTVAVAPYLTGRLFGK
jgi:hypothetical protein